MRWDLLRYFTVSLLELVYPHVRHPLNTVSQVLELYYTFYYN